MSLAELMNTALIGVGVLLLILGFLLLWLRTRPEDEEVDSSLYDYFRMKATAFMIIFLVVGPLFIILGILGWR